MSSRPASSLSLRPNLEQQKKRARELLQAFAAGDAEAVRRLRAHHPRLSHLDERGVAGSAVSLRDARLVVARECGFPSWHRLKAHVEAAAAARRMRLFETDLDYYEDRARGLVSMFQAGLPNALEQIREWHPRFAGASDEQIRAASFDIEDARTVYARAHGLRTWKALLARVGALARHPELAHARGTNGNSLLGLADAVHGAARGPAAGTRAGQLELVEVLLRAGADVNAANDRGWTALHQAGYGNRVAVAERLLAAGADPEREAHGAGGTPLVAALFWGHREVAEALAARSLAPRNLRVAAGLGRVEQVRQCFDGAGRLTAGAGRARGFYRPHSGFPVWQPSDDPQEILDEALVWAAKSDRTEVMPLLVERGARLAADPYRGTPLIWAAANRRSEAIRWLLDHGADVNQRATFGGPGHGQGVTALHLAAQCGDLATVRLLVERGSDLAIEDDLYHGSPLGWAMHAGHHEVAEFLRGRSAATS